MLSVVVFFKGCISMVGFVCRGGFFGWVILWSGFFGCEGIIGIGVCILGSCLISLLGGIFWMCIGFVLLGFFLLGFFLLFCFCLGCIWLGGGLYFKLFLLLVFYFFLRGCGLYVVVVLRLVLLLLENELLCF